MSGFENKGSYCDKTDFVLISQLLNFSIAFENTAIWTFFHTRVMKKYFDPLLK